MHNAGFRSLSLPFQYKAFSIPDQDFEREFQKLKKTAYGFNITIPYKEKVIPFLDRLTKKAEQLWAVNTIFFENGTSIGENTDMDGFKQALKELYFTEDSGFLSSSNFSSIERTAFIFGAGGAAKASAAGLMEMGIHQFVIWSRTEERISHFSSWLNQQNSRKEGKQGEKDIEAKFMTAKISKNAFQSAIIECNIIVNAAPLEAIKDLHWFPEIKLKKKSVVADWVYSPIKTPWLEKAESNKGKIIEGYKILLYQGMKAFELWTGEKAPEQVMKKSLLKALL